MPVSDSVRMTTSGGRTQPDAWLLWTGGWDSTFRLLQLVLDTSATVQPNYVIDPERAATLHELRAMSAIRRSIEDQIAGAAERLLPTRFYLRDEIPEDAVLAAAFLALRRRAHLGGQYAWLARLAKQLDTDRLELAIHRDDTAYGFVQDRLVRLEDAGVGPYHRLAPDAPPELVVFARFRFPVIQWTKVMMRDWARSRGVGNILEQTWFCHCPIGDHPCGTCRPCRYAMAEGMQDRFTLVGRSRHRVAPLLGWGSTLVTRVRGAAARSARAVLTRRSSRQSLPPRRDHKNEEA